MSNFISIPTGTMSLLTQIEREACQASFFEFVQSFWDVVIKEKPVYNWHIPFLCNELQKLSVCIVARQAKLYDIIINIPPGTTKSTIVSIMFPAWLWTQDRTLRIISNSYSMDLSIEHATKSRDILTSDRFRRLFPEVVIRKDKGAKSSYENTDTGARYTTSTGGTITGKHAHLIINDDPLNPAQAASDADRKAANEHTKTLASRKVDKENTPIVTMMQRLHEDDPTGYMLKKKSEGIFHICLPAELSDAVKPATAAKNYVDGLLDPSRLNRKVLAEARTDLGSKGYANQFDQSPTADGGNIIKNAWFGYVDAYTFGAMRKHEPIVFFGDTAYTENSEDNDPSGFLATCKIGNDLYITAGKKVYEEFPELIKSLPIWVKASGYGPSSSVRIEPKASGKSVVQTMKRDTNLNVVETPTPKDDKKTRLSAAAPKVEAGRVYLVRGPWNEEFVDEVCGFPNKVHDEYVDLLVYAVNYHLDSVAKSADKLSNLFGR